MMTCVPTREYKVIPPLVPSAATTALATVWFAA
jgi:hypothetical protein